MRETETLLIVTEANEKVASGHLFECIVCYKELVKKKREVHLMINADIPYKFRERLPQEYVEYPSDIQNDIPFLLKYIQKNHVSVIIFNLRKIENNFIRSLKRIADLQIVCIDEFGHRELDADIIINPMVDQYYWKYENSNTHLFCGSKYLILSPEIVEYHSKEKIINEKVRVITVSMGGVDAPGTTVKLVKWMKEAGIAEQAHINLVLGGAFCYKDELWKEIANDEKFCVYQNISDIYELFWQSDLAVCAGGNTLHELAAIGVPTIVIPSMPHEERNGKTFEEMGFSLCCDNALNVRKTDFLNSFIAIKDFEVRSNMSCKGKMISDGMGYRRVCDIIENMCL